MPIKSSARKLIGEASEAMAFPDQAGRYDDRLFLAISDLGGHAQKIISDAGLLADVLDLAGDVGRYRGRGRQIAADTMSKLLSHLVWQMEAKIPQGGVLHESFPDARQAHPDHIALIDAFEKLATQAMECIQGGQSRSEHMSRIRADAWHRLGRICIWVAAPAFLVLALRIAGNMRAASREREAAIEFLPTYWLEDEPDEETVELLDQLEKDPPDRSFLRTFLQTQIELGLNDDMGAMVTMDDWKDAHPDSW